MTEGPKLTGRHVRLRAIRPDDFEYLYTLASAPDVGFRWRFRGRTPSPDVFATLLWQNVLAQFIAERRDTGERIGFVQAFDASERDGWCHFAMVLDPRVGRSVWAIEAALLHLNYVFTNWNFRAVYCEVAEFNYEQMQHGLFGVFQVEGTLRNHAFYRDRYWDMLLLVLRRADFEKVLARIENAGRAARELAQASVSTSPEA